MKNGLVKDGDEINCRECIYGRVCTVARGHDYKVGSCNQYKETKMTNADRIRAMTDEELAELFIHNDTFFCPRSINDMDYCRKADGCRNCFLKWLKQEDDT